MSSSLQPHGLQLSSPPYPSPTPEVYSNSCPLSRWCHPTISSSVIPFSSHLQSFPASKSFQMSQFFASGGQSIGVSASASVLPMNIQDWFLLGLTGLISMLRDSQDSSPAQFESISSSVLSLLYGPTLIPSPEDLPNPGTEPRSLSLQADSLPSESPGKIGRASCRERV